MAPLQAKRQREMELSGGISELREGVKAERAVTPVRKTRL